MKQSQGPRRHGRQLRYGKVRERIRTGDVLLFKGKGPLSAFIRWGSGSDYSHAAIASWEGARLMVYHAVFKGVRYAPASEAVHRYDGQVDWWSPRPAIDPQIDRGAIVAQARANIGKPFATIDLAKLVWLMFLGKYQGTPDPADPPPAMFCSWYVSHCYRVGGGVDLCPIAADCCTSPAMLERSRILMLRGILHRDPQRQLDDEPAQEPAP